MTTDWVYPPHDAELHDVVRRLIYHLLNNDLSPLVIADELSDLDGDAIARLVWYIDAGTLGASAILSPAEWGLGIPDDVFEAVNSHVKSSIARTFLDLTRKDRRQELHELAVMLWEERSFMLYDAIGDSVALFTAMMAGETVLGIGKLMQRAVFLRLHVKAAREVVKNRDWCGGCLHHAMDVLTALDDAAATIPLDDVKEKDQ